MVRNFLYVNLQKVYMALLTIYGNTKGIFGRGWVALDQLILQILPFQIGQVRGSITRDRT